MGDWVAVNVTQRQRIAVCDEPNEGFLWGFGKEAVEILLRSGRWLASDDLRLLRVGENIEGGYRIAVRGPDHWDKLSVDTVRGLREELGLVVNATNFTVISRLDLPIIWQEVVNSDHDIPRDVPLLCVMNGDVVSMIAEEDGEGYLHWRRASDSEPTHFMRYPIPLPEIPKSE